MTDCRRSQDTPDQIRVPTNVGDLGVYQPNAGVVETPMLTFWQSLTSYRGRELLSAIRRKTGLSIPDI